MRCGLFGARADAGGLATMTREFARHIPPERTLIVDLGDKGRGETHHDWYPDAVVQYGMDHLIEPETILRFCDGLDLVIGFETFYRADFCALARSVGCRTLLIAMPELYRADHAPPDACWVPTTWEIDRVPNAEHVPWPVARDRLPFRQRNEARIFHHVAATPFHDRNGGRILLAALRHVRSDIDLTVRGGRGHWPTRVGPVAIFQLAGTHEDYWRAWPDEADVLVMPRRYAGQCLPVAEAASLGIVPLMLDLPPYDAVLPPECRVPARGSFPVNMGGLGRFDVHGADPRVLAAAIDRLAGDPPLVGRLSATMDEWSSSSDWSSLHGSWVARLEEIAERPVATTP